MKKIILLGIIIAFAVGCKKENENLIKQDVKYLQTGEIVNCKDCFSSTNASSEGFVIDNEDSYKQFENLLRKDTDNKSIDCDTVSLPKIDFNKYTLIGILTVTGVCDSISKSVMTNLSKTKMIYNISIKRPDGFCTDQGYISLNFVEIPKPPINYTVEFNVKDY